MSVLSLEDAKRQLRQGGEAIDAEREAEINGYIADAAAWVERYTGHILVARDVTEHLDAFDGLRLRAWPIKPGAPLSVGYDVLGTPAAVTGVRLAAASRPAAVLPALGSRWPVCGYAAVSVTVRAGYEAGDIVPGDLRRAMLVLIAAYDADREGGDVLAKAEATARMLCGEYRLRRV